MDWSWPLSAIIVLSMWLIGNKRRIGHLVGLAAEGCWTWYGAATGQWGFFAFGVGMAAVYLRNWWLWRPIEPEPLGGWPYEGLG